MKRSYSKPIIIIEEFDLLEHIARCSVYSGKTEVTYRSPDDGCTYSDANVTLFYDSCNVYFDPTMFDSLQEYLDSFKEEGSGCYNAFADGNFFAS